MPYIGVAAAATPGSHLARTAQYTASIDRNCTPLPTGGRRECYRVCGELPCSAPAHGSTRYAGCTGLFPIQHMLLDWTSASSRLPRK